MNSSSLLVNTVILSIFLFKTAKLYYIFTAIESIWT